MLPQPNWPEGHDQKAAALVYLLSAWPHMDMAPLAGSTGVPILVRKST